MKFSKYHGLGNDYIVMDPADFGQKPDERQIRLICSRNRGIGSDGILFGPIETQGGPPEVRIFNPDGSEAEKSGNGLRIFARYLYDRGLVTGEPFTVATIGGTVTARVFESGKSVSVQMGKVSFDSAEIPVKGHRREVLNETIEIEGRAIKFCAATIGNPHCVIFEPEISEERTRLLGPGIENHPVFPNRTNVQFVRIMDKKNIAAMIWERGAGYTRASGSSASAAAAAAFRLGLCGEKVTVHMPGGELEIETGPDYSIYMTGPVTAVAEGRMHPELLDQPELEEK